MISQASYIAAFLFIGFLVYITVKGELPAYKDAILGAGNISTAPPTPSKVLSGLAVLPSLLP